MGDFLLDFDLLDGVVFGCVLLLVLAVLWSALAADRRAKRLSRDNPPTAEELKEAEALRRAGSFQMRGRASAPARHFEDNRRQIDRSSGGPGCYEPPLVDTWRDRRSKS